MSFNKVFIVSEENQGVDCILCAFESLELAEKFCDKFIKYTSIEIREVIVLK